MNPVSPDFLIIPMQVIRDTRLQQVDRLVYGIVYWYEHLKDGRCFASNSTIANVLGTTGRVVQNGMTRLEEFGYIRRIYKDGAKRNRTEIQCTVAYKYSKSANVPQDTRVRPIDDSAYHLQMTRGRIRNKNKEKNTSASQSDANIPVIIDLFKEVNPSYANLFKRMPQRMAVERLLKAHGVEKLTSIISYLPKSNAAKYAPVITTPLQLEERLGALIAWSQKQKDPGTSRKYVI